MVPLARPPHDPHGRELIIAIFGDCPAQRDMLSLLLSRRRLAHRSYGEFEALRRFIAPLRHRGDAISLLLMVGPGLPQGAARQLDDTLRQLECPVTLVAFEDPMRNADEVDWSRSEVRPSLQTSVPPRLFEVLRTIDDTIEATRGAQTDYNSSKS